MDLSSHVEVSKDGHGSLSPALFGVAEKYFGSHERPSIDRMAA
ncbi:hypothetical protein [Nonomuraea sp. CA-141351]